MNDYVLVLVSAALVSSLYMLQQPVSRLRLHVFGLACALATVLGVSGGCMLERIVVVPMQLQGLQLFLLLPWLALIAYAVPAGLGRLRPGWPTAGLALPVMTNALVLGLTLHIIDNSTGGFATLGASILSGLGFWLALALFDDLLQRGDHDDVPHALQGLPLALIGAGVMVMAFSGFNGLFMQ
ncbi:Rnf-Nqr domain containing protein [Pseudomonas sp. PSKL.D1]|uniref:Rnf-Nqr domain containing protein n=1 Tax=Pseudomonas sp. PSKL.D1 TaxID=3029060 RepID=UPI0023818BE5|nr:Rnf-Nqr domain containing protein [Pseudomonas sp. PSKL.D1]WDY59123.1 Rnf-Nqr domain containing protein [Pseudomonas sp. PSKL.D1]